jgi:hypothetical protein
MELSNHGTSVYHRFRGHVERDSDGHLTILAGSKVPSSQSLNVDISGHVVDQHRRIPLSVEGLALYETGDRSSDAVRGILVSSESESPFESFFAETILSQTDLLDANPTHPIAGTDREVIEVLTNLFDRELRNIVPNDAWEATGRAYFVSRVEHFVSRNMALELILPAFPCKSSNGSKVASRSPDRGEELALRRLHRFVQKVEEAYRPGARLWIVSDGHVFSDCSKCTPPVFVVASC